MYSASSLRSEETDDTIVNMKDLGDLVEEVNNKMVKGEGERLTRSTRQNIKLKKTCHLLSDLALPVTRRTRGFEQWQVCLYMSHSQMLGKFEYGLPAKF